MAAGYVRDKIRAKHATSLRDIIRQQARAYAEQLIPAANPLSRLSTLDLVTRLKPRYTKPVHLTPMVDVLERSWSEPVRATFHAPPQHGKTDLISTWIVATLLRFPHLRIVYATASMTLAEDKSGKIRAMARAAGVLINPETDSKGEWATTDGGGLFACGIEQGFTGRPADVIFVDDPYPKRKHARSRAWQATVASFWQDQVETRARANTSIFVQHTRWTTTDLIALIKAGKFSGSMDGGAGQFVHVSLAAEDAAGNPLWPEHYTRELLATKKANLVTWWSLYMGEPRAEGSEIFRNELVTYQSAQLPKGGPKSIGLDFGYTAKTSSDPSVAFVMTREGRGVDARFYIHRERLHMQATAPVFATAFRTFRAQHPTARCRAYVSGTERGAGDYLNSSTASGGTALGVDMRTARDDKMVRALPFSAAWNAGHVLVPEDAPWAIDLLEKLAAFTGAGGDEEDDEIDALAAAFDVLAEGGDLSVMSGGQREAVGLGSAYGVKRGGYSYG